MIASKAGIRQADHEAAERFSAGGPRQMQPGPGRDRRKGWSRPLLQQLGSTTESDIHDF
jgi:hypothetical protein